MRVFVATQALPNRGGSAVNIVLEEAIHVIREMGHEVILQPISAPGAVPSETEIRRLGELAAAGVHAEPVVTPPALAASRPSRGGKLAALRHQLVPDWTRVYPALRVREEVAERVRKTAADAILVFWDPAGLAATYGLREVPKVAYYGMPDYMAEEARLRRPALFGIPHRSLRDRGRLFLGRRLNAKRRTLHFRLMRDCHTAGNICAFHAELYARMGHPRSLYMRNMWPDGFRLRWRQERRAREEANTVKLLGSLGPVITTGNTFGLEYLGREILPRLERRLGATAFEIHIYGNGEPYPEVARLLARPSVRFRGWVPDIDGEILSSKLFLVMNNTGYYKGSHTRFLHAWSAGACVVAHVVNARAMPEIRHMTNALLGETPEEIVELIVRALGDPQLRWRIGEGGRKTYEEYFRPEVAVPIIVEELERLTVQGGARR